MAGLTLNSPVGVDFEGVNSGRYVNMTLSGYYSGISTTAGSMSLLVDGVLYEGFCIDPYQPAQSYLLNDYLVQSLDTVSHLNSDKAQALADILSQWNDDMTATEFAGMQLAIWEVAAETLTTYDLQSGSYTAGSSLEVITKAYEYLGYVGSGLGNTQDYLALTHLGSQDFVVRVAAVPAPGAILLGGFGALLVSKLRKRRLS